MEQTTTQSAENTLKFNGRGSELLGIMLLNWLLTAVTLGIYYPWARVNRIKFFWENSELNGSPFAFHGTGKELFKGFIKVLLLFGAFYGLIIYGRVSGDLFIYFIGVAVFAIALLFIIPLAIHGAMRYRLSRTSWRGIHFGYRGSRSQLVSDFVVSSIITLVTFGLYSSWFTNNLRKYVIGNIRFGNLKFSYDGDGTDLFVIKIKGYFLSFFTLGIYYFWYKKEWINYYIGHVRITQNEQVFRVKASLSGWNYLVLSFTNLLLVFFTLGFGAPWAIVRTANFIIDNLELPAEINFDVIAQTEDEYKDAAGDDVIDFLDLGIV